MYVDVLVDGIFYCQLLPPPNVYSINALKAYVKDKLPSLKTEREWDIALSKERAGC